MPADTAFVIIANPFTGAKHFSDLLNAHQDISCHHEVFHRDTVYLLNGAHDDLINKRNENPIGFLKQLYNSCTTKACGFKIFMNQNEYVLDNVLRDKSIKKIVLYRPNLLATHWSSKIAEAEKYQTSETHTSAAILNKLVFIHIPKTAGMSLHFVLEEHFGKNSSIRFGNQAQRAKFSNLGPEEFKKYDYITGHLSMAELIGKEIEFPSIAVVRDPLKRLLSMLQYLRTSDHPDHKNFNFNDVNSFAQYLKESGQFNMQCWQLCGKHTFEDAVDMIRRKCIYVAPLEYYDDFLKTISNLLKNELKNIRRNVTPKKDMIQLTDKDIAILSDYIEEDTKLVKYIHSNYMEIKNNFIAYVKKHQNAFQDPIKPNAQIKKVPFDTNDFEECIKTYQKHYKDTIDLLNQTNQEYLFVNFEDYHNESIYRRVFPYLRLKQPDLHKTIKEKINDSNIISRFTNPDEVRKYLSSTGRLHWANEGFMCW
jgi:hypothetical protein